MKKRITKWVRFWLAGALVAGSFLTADTTNAQVGGLDQKRKQRMNTGKDVPLGDYYTGRSPYKPFKRDEAPAPTYTPPPPATVTCDRVHTELHSMIKTMPREVSLGETFTFEIKVTARACLADVVVTDMLPAGLEFVSAEPAATRNGNNLVWKFSEMDPNTYATLKVNVKATKEGDITNCAKIHALPRTCAQVLVGKASLTLKKTGPARALLGSDVTYDITVTNTGTSVAKNVVVTDTIPDGLTHSSGNKSVTFNVGDLAPKQSRTIPVTLKAAKRGNHCNKAMAKSQNAGEASDEACTLVVARGLELVKTGDKKAILGKTANYKIVVSNTGDTDLTDVIVTDSAPAETSIVRASDGGSVSGNSVVWSLGTLAKGAKKELTVTLTSRIAGTHCNSATVRTAEGLTKSSQACTVWEGLPALLLEMVDNPGQIRVDEGTVYTITVENQGTAKDTNIRLEVTFPEGVKPVSTPDGAINGNKVVMTVYPTLQPGGRFAYTINAKGAAEGIHVITVTRISDSIPVKISEEETTRVY